ncbi:MAG TPA: glutamate--tRNA ligase [Thermoanaerobaculia bacterium]|jgi:glutamyl-tRNA synthetase|nr:glutamate--tRNA ligase [Thermoanaerobaculia bacterium]
MSVRVRFAPSPTGSLHVGGARTALYNFLFARHHGGTHVLRIEDTDVERSRTELTDQILRSLEWLRIRWDEGPIHQSDRMDLYRARADALLDSGKAYRCFCTPEELDLDRKKAEAEKRAYQYSKKCRPLDAGDAGRRAGPGEKFVVRLRVGPEPIVVDDLIRGRVEFPAGATDDFVLVRSGGHPLYHFTVCVDDVDMRITHVIRGDDHLANTPKHVALFAALGAPVPQFAHLGMIYGTDRKKLSKRHGAASVEEWRDAGVFPEALVNFLALLGWSPGDDREIMTLEEMIRDFSLDRVGASPSVFDPEKLLWMNSKYLAAMTPAELFLRLDVDGAELPPEPAALAAIELHRERSRTLTELRASLADYTADPSEYDAAGLKKNVGPDTPSLLASLAERFSALADFRKEALEATLRELAAEKGTSAGKLIHPLRLAATGKTVGAPLFDVLELLGKETALRRIEAFLRKIEVAV